LPEALTSMLFDSTEVFLLLTELIWLWLVESVSNGSWRHSSW